MLRREIEDVVKSKEVIIIINLCLDEILDPHCNYYIFVEVFGLGALWRQQVNAMVHSGYGRFLRNWIVDCISVRVSAV
jgi:hypothetical protein